MTNPRVRSRYVAALAATAIAALGISTVSQVAATASPSTTLRGGDKSPGAKTLKVVTPGDPVPGLADLTDPLTAQGKTLSVKPAAAQLAAARNLGSGVDVTWNDSGTPASVFARDGVLAPAVAGKTPEETARDYLVAHAGLLGISADQARNLELVNPQHFAGSKAGSGAEAVLFRQRFGGMTPATRSMVTVGMAADGHVAYLSSSLAKASGPAPAAVLTPLQGWLKAAANVGRAGIGAGSVSVAAKKFNGWTSLRVPGFDQPQLARLRAYATSDGDVRPVIESDVVDTTAGNAFAYRVMVDAVTGTVLFRQNLVDNSDNVTPFSGMYTPTSCSTSQPFDLTDGQTQSIAITATSSAPADDITIKLYNPAGTNVATFDTGTSPEAGSYSPGTTLTQGTWSFAVCPFDATQKGGQYNATVVTSDLGTGGTGGVVPNPRWRAFQANPTLTSTSSYSGFPDNSAIECWFPGTTGCSARETHQDTSSFGPWDSVNGLPTFTTIGNNANTHEAWGSPLTPGGAEQAPYSPMRDYTQTFTDSWNNNKCDPSNFVGTGGVPVQGGNDIDQVVTNLFTGHNRIHDFAYALGFTEANYNLQTTNGGRGGVQGDPEIGNAQAGAISGGANGMYLGRDNANQIAEQDGVPGITNQYLFQPIAGAFYSPCADGALDTGIYGHEYTHAISNRMVGGPDDGLTSAQGGAMGESWSDLDAGEYQFENNYPTGTNPWALGAYTTGNYQKGIRDYAINDNVLNFSDIGFDTTGPEVHADGEIWNGTQWEVRQAMVDKYNATFPYTDAALQQRCATPTADPTRPQPSADQCPGNRRWLQLIYDAWLLQPGATDMLQARNAMMAADQMRFGGANQATLAEAFARRGMGADAVSPTPDSDAVTPSFRSAYGPNSTVTFAGAGAGKVYVGDYEARVDPVADLDPATPLPASATFTPGYYRITYMSPTRGMRRFILNVPSSGVDFGQPIDDTALNVAAVANGGSIIDSTAGSITPDALIDGTESTSWAGETSDNVNVSQPGVSVALGGGLQTINAIKVSAALSPATKADADAGSRFTALRQFALQACTSNCAAAGATYTTVYTSPADAFPSVIPRPVQPDLSMRTFRFSPVQAAAVRLVALNNQCTGQAAYAGDQDNDPQNNSDCVSGSDRGTIVHAAELEVFSGAIPDDPPPGLPGGVSAPQAPAGHAAAMKTKIRVRLVQHGGRHSRLMPAGNAARLVYQVVAKHGSMTSGGKKAGRAVVRLDGHKVAKKRIKVTRRHGRHVHGYVFRIPVNLGVGVHRLVVKFKPFKKSGFAKSRSRRIVITVVRR